MKLDHKILATLSFALMLAPLAHAWDSPEVALVLNRNADLSYQINRYDTTTGTFLGSYAKTGGNYVPINIQETGNITHVFGYDDGAEITDQSFNMSTGQFLGSKVIGTWHDFGLYGLTGVQWMAGKSGTGAYLLEGVKGDGNNYLFDTDLANPEFTAIGNGDGGHLRYDAASGMLAAVDSGMYFQNGGKAGVIKGFQVNEGAGTLTTVSTDNLDTYNFDGSNGYFDGPISVAMQYLNGQLTTVFSRAENVYSGGALASSEVHQTPIDITASNGALGEDESSGFSLTEEVPNFVAFGHSQNLYSLTMEDGTAYWERFNAHGLNQAYLGDVTLDGLNNPLDMVVYAAPEPTAFLAFAPLAAGLLWKRRSRKA